MNNVISYKKSNKISVEQLTRISNFYVITIKVYLKDKLYILKCKTTNPQHLKKPMYNIRIHLKQKLAYKCLSPNHKEVFILIGRPTTYLLIIHQFIFLKKPSLVLQSFIINFVLKKLQ